MYDLRLRLENHGGSDQIHGGDCPGVNTLFGTGGLNLGTEGPADELGSGRPC